MRTFNSTTAATHDLIDRLMQVSEPMNELAPYETWAEWWEHFSQPDRVPPLPISKEQIMQGSIDHPYMGWVWPNLVAKALNLPGANDEPCPDIEQEDHSYDAILLSMTNNEVACELGIRYLSIVDEHLKTCIEEAIRRLEGLDQREEQRRKAIETIKNVGQLLDSHNVPDYHYRLLLDQFNDWVRENDRPPSWVWVSGTTMEYQDVFGDPIVRIVQPDPSAPCTTFLANAENRHIGEYPDYETAMLQAEIFLQQHPEWNHA